MHANSTLMRLSAAVSGAAIAALALSACSPQAHIELDNQSGQDVRIDDARGVITAPAGQVTGGLASGASKTIRAGDCTYAFTGLLTTLAQPREDRPLLGGPTYVYRVRLEPDFSLRLFSMTGGNAGTEITGQGWPARPQVACGDKG